MSDFQGHVLPPFPVDDATLDLLWAAIHPDPDSGATRSSVGDFLDLMATMGGSDLTAVAEQFDENSFVMRDQHYHEHDVLVALIEEVRRLRMGVSS